MMRPTSRDLRSVTKRAFLAVAATMRPLRQVQRYETKGDKFEGGSFIETIGHRCVTIEEQPTSVTKSGYFFKETAYIFRKGQGGREEGAKAGRSGGA